MLPDGRLWKEPEHATPPPPPTGYSNNGCYLRRLSDCCSTISKEHYISRSALEIFETDGNVRVTGMPWFQPGESRVLPINGLAANILCVRHNTALSSFDAEAG